MANEKATNRLNFTQNRLEALTNPDKKVVRYFDAKVPGLALYVTDKGAKSFYIYRKVHGKLEQRRIGAFPALNVDEARTLAQELNVMLEKGEEPPSNKVRAQADATFSDLFDWYIEHHAKPRKKDQGKKDLAQYRLYLQELGKQVAHKVSRADIQALHSQVLNNAGRTAANRMLALVKTVYSVAIDLEAFPLASNPAQRIKMAKEESRKRRLEHREIGPFLQAIEDDGDLDIKDFLSIALYTGARKSNVLAMRWDQINFTTCAWTIPGEEFKNGEAHTVPLPDAVQGILQRRNAQARGPYVFPSKARPGHPMVEPKRGLARVLSRANISDLHLHDLRRTLATFMSESGVSETHIGLVLGHKPKSITGVYTRPSLEVLRESMERGIALIHRVAKKPR
jgi:integrase